MPPLKRGSELLETNPIWYLVFWSIIIGITIEFIAVAIYELIKYIKKALLKERKNILKRIISYLQNKFKVVRHE